MLQGHSSSVTNCIFQVDGLALITSGADGVIKTWDLKSSKCTSTLNDDNSGHSERVAAMFSYEDIHDNDALNPP